MELNKWRVLVFIIYLTYGTLIQFGTIWLVNNYSQNSIFLKLVYILIATFLILKGSNVTKKIMKKC